MVICESNVLSLNTARGSGWPEHEVKELVKNYKNSKNMMKASKGRQMQGFLRKLGMG